MVIEILTPGARVFVQRGFLLVNDAKAAPLDDVDGVICGTPAVTFSGQAAVALAQRGASVVFCGADYLPSSVLLPYSSHTTASRRARLQADAKDELKEKLWRQIVCAKVQNQSAHLAHRGADNAATQLATLARRVDSAPNAAAMEAQAARVYWRALFGKDFRRVTRGASGANAALNWGYAVIRSAVARRLCVAGLIPSLGLHHANRYNPLCLADDVMEPFRPLADFLAAQNPPPKDAQLTPEDKARMAEVLQQPMRLNDKTYRAENAVREAIVSLARAVETGKGKLALAAFCVED